jgi:hypothetical protein
MTVKDVLLSSQHVIRKWLGVVRGTEGIGGTKDGYKKQIPHRRPKCGRVRMTFPRSSTAPSRRIRLRPYGRSASRHAFGISLAAICLSAACGAAAEWLPAFAACRILYTTHNPVQDTIRCHVYTALGLSSIVFFVVGLIAGLAALARRIAPSSTGNPTTGH